MPLSFLGELLDHATSEEKRRQEEKARKELTKLWFVHYLAKSIANEAPIPYEQFMAEALRPAAGNATAAVRAAKKRTAEEIMAEFAPIIDADSRKE